MSLISNNLAYLTESPIWNTLITSPLELPNDIDNYDDNENEEDDNNMKLQSQPRAIQLKIHIVWFCFNGFLSSLE